MARQVRRIPAPRVLRVQTAVMIPDGMHGIEDGYHSSGYRAADRLVGGGLLAVPGAKPGTVLNVLTDRLIASGIPAGQARAIVARAHGRHLARGHRHAPGLRKRAGMGDGVTVDSSVLAKAQDTQTQHRALLDAYGAASSDADRQDVRNQLDALYNDWTQYAVGVEGGAPPVQWNRADPTAAVLIAVRDDLANSASLIDSGKAQAALQKQIVASWNAQAGPVSIVPPGVSVGIPWYVWAGGAVAGGLALRRIFG